ncbi:CtsR family transcriptional regulator [Sporolituus thermophilus]|uniref:Transcriptional regulator CtsR n=1 Tax=Sporolituus thermophilus DSM 23256 TaxID=1123285 RepID=A0A1G7PE53_9FIRM|nr:CtsR family transcriptional regulator [Sporolituus thermophilus]SDF84464.1 transcriptional regulator CtsR [Sporolituus thermophilus DSM 23256]
MANLVDLIEQFILHKLETGQDEVIILKRNEIADELECAPSQVSYVLSTRFTVERGFIVESRRGSGGYIRIARIPLAEILFEDVARSVRPDITYDELEMIADRLRRHNLLTGREAALMLHFFKLIYDYVDAEDRARIVRSLLMGLAHHEKLR